MKKLALLIGVSEYQPGLNPLPAAVKDISALGKVLRDPELGNFDSVEILPNPDCQEMQFAIETLLENRTKEDLVLLFFSGHGIKDHDYNKLHFATRITRKNNQGRLIVSSAVAARFVHDLINSPSNRQLKRLVIILDCCFSGAFDPALSAKDGGSIDLKSELGAEGRIVLTASDSTQYAFEQKGADLSVYTRYLVQGIETGLGDLDEDGWVSVSELHDYAARQVQQAAPLMTPQLITLRGNITKNFDIKLAKAKLTDPKLKFRKKVTEYLTNGQFLPAAKRTLEAYRKQLNLTPEEASEIIADILRPFQEYRDNLQQYREAFRESCEHQYPLIESELASLRDLQRILALRDEDIEPIQQEIEALFANKSLKKVEIQTITITGIKNGKAIIQSQTKQIELFTEDLGNNILLEMIKIPAGQFWMGQTELEKQELIRQLGEEGYQKLFARELPRHQVSLQSFFLAKYPITQAQYQQIMGDNPSKFKDFEDSFNLPVENVSWEMVREFCQKLSEKTGKNYSLPSEAQWEYACRAGTETPFSLGETITTDYVNYDGNYSYGDEPKGESRRKTTPVNKFFPNAFGLYDMHGNVWEWCEDGVVF
jgi:formylglycine-generating enzyme required for sulfatase activity